MSGSEQLRTYPSPNPIESCSIGNRNSSYTEFLITTQEILDQRQDLNNCVPSPPLTQQNQRITD